MQSQSDGNSTMFANRGLDELIPYFGRGFNGTTFNEFADAYLRMLEIAFHDVSTPNQDRALAATWAHVLESLIVLTLVGHERLLRPFMEARNRSKQQAETYGYGSIGWVAMHDSKKAIDRICLDDESLQNLKRAAVNERRTFLLSVAFGRAADASNRAC
jgi:hypothetical protein